MSRNPQVGGTRAEFAAAVQEYYENKRANYDRAFHEVFGQPPELEFREAEKKSTFTSEMSDRSKGGDSGQQTGDLASGASSTQASQGSGSGAKATANDHKAMPGPVIAENLPPVASKEELKKRTEELNK